MATTILQKKRTEQAREHVYVDFSNPLANGLISAYGLTSYEMPVRFDGVYGKLSGKKSSATAINPYTLHGYLLNGDTEAVNVLTQEGSAWSFNGTYSTKAYSSSHPRSWTTPVTFIIRVYLNSNTADQCIIGNISDGHTPDYLYGCGIYISGGTLYGVGANNNSRVISATAPDTDKWVTIACVTNTTDGRLYIDGQLVASGTLAGAYSNYVFGIGCSGATSAIGHTNGTSFLNGMVGYALTYKRALSSVEIYALSKNPYQILRSRRNYLVDVIAGLSSVSNDVVLSYNLLSYAQQDKTIEWNTLNSVNTDGSVSWDINTSVTSDKTFSWDALNQVIADKVIEWNLEQYVQSDKGMSWDILNNVVSDGILSWNTTSSVTTDVNTTWNIVSSVFADKTINYDILVSANQNVSLSWNINQFVFADKGLMWDIESTMLTAFADLPLRYDIVNSVYKDFNTYWNLLQSAYSDNTISFNALNSVLQDQSIAWGISEAVVNDLIITANLLSATQQDLTLVWDSAGIVSGDLVIRYNITSQNVTLPPLERILVISQETRTIKSAEANREIKIEQSSRIISIQ